MSCFFFKRIKEQTCFFIAQVVAETVWETLKNVSRRPCCVVARAFDSFFAPFRIRSSLNENEAGNLQRCHRWRMKFEGNRWLSLNFASVFNGWCLGSRTGFSLHQQIHHDWKIDSIKICYLDSQMNNESHLTWVIRTRLLRRPFSKLCTLLYLSLRRWFIFFPTI